MLVCEWKDGEVGYCLALVRSRGNNAVGRTAAAVSSYCALQAADAYYQQRFDVANPLQAASDDIKKGDWLRAEKRLSDALERKV